MSKKLCVYTCITGDYDNLPDIKVVEKNIDYLCFTNNKNIKSKLWKVIYIDNDGLDNHHLSRKIKMLGHDIISKNYDISVWMDASIVWQKSISDFVKKYFNNTTFAAFKHSHNNSIHEEAKTCLLHNKDSKNNILKTLEYLDSEHFPDNLGLFEMTVFIKKHNNPKVQETMALWFNLNQKLSKRDQLEFMYTVWKTGLQVSTINLNVWNNDYFTYQLHNNAPINDSFQIYYGNFDINFDYNNYLSYKYKILNNEYSTNINIPVSTNEIEIFFTNSRGVIVSNFNIENKISSVSYINCVQNKEKKLFYSTYNVIKITGNFEKNHKLSFSIQMMPASQIELIENIEFLQSAFYQKILENQKLIESQIIASKYKTELDNIKSSKSWRVLQTIKKLLPPYKH